MKANAIEIHTPEGVVLSQLLAGPVIRFAAWVIDSMVIVSLISMAMIIIRLLHLLNEDIASALSIIAYFILSISYGMACEWWWRGQTIGKKLFRLRVVDAEGLRLQANQIVIRNLVRFVDILPVCYVVGGAACWLSRKNQRLGDIAANTLVIRHPRISEPDLDQLFAGKYNSLRLHPHLEARLRQQTSPKEASVALQALLRRDDFAPADRIELFSSLAQHFQRKAAYPPESIEGITAEQYIRNVVDVLYRASAKPLSKESGTGMEV